MPLVWCLGSIVGPMIGGNLARPCSNMPSLFPAGSLWDKYPYLLPNLFSAATCVFGVVVGLLFLEETHADKKDRHDPGLELGKCLARRFSWATTTKAHAQLAHAQETASLLSRGNDQPPSYRTNDSSPQLPSTPAVDVEQHAEVVGSRLRASGDARRAQVEKPPLSARQAFTRPVIMNIVSYGILALWVTDLFFFLCSFRLSIWMPPPTSWGGRGVFVSLVSFLFLPSKTNLGLVR